MKSSFIDFLKNYELKVSGLSRDLSLAYFNATISGKKEDYDEASRLQLELSKIYSDKNDFKLLKDFKSSDDIKDPLLLRQLELIYNEYASHQFDEKLMEKIIRLSTETEEKFSTFRVKSSGKELTDNQVDEILKNSTDSNELESVWKASKEIGSLVVNDVIALVKMRNESARILGYNDYYTMSLELSEQNAGDMEKLFDELDRLTGEAFAGLKAEIDQYLSAYYNIPAKSLMPWHYQDRFFQQGPKIYSVNLDSYFENKNLVELTKKFFSKMGMEIEDLIEKSDLYEKEGKYQHAYCTDIDRCGDVRVVCNIKPNHKWMSTMLHEYGHAVYDKYIDKNLPWELRTHAHIFTTEAIAMFFGRLSSDPAWLSEFAGISKDEAEKISNDCFNTFRLEQLVFSRWIQVMFRFEKELYSNPDQNLNLLWWNLVEKYQLIKKPEGRNEPDWASKIHIALYPAYYHNYMLGELLASQFYYYLINKVDKNFPKTHTDTIGDYFINHFFVNGARMRWDDLIKSSTGETLTPEYYAKQVVGSL